MDFFCPYCKKLLKNPIECKNCYTNFCEEHINDFNNCPTCNAPFSSIINSGIKKLIAKYENKIINDKIKNGQEIIKCTLCPFENRIGYFCFHLAEEHKKELIETFGEKKINEIKKEEYQLADRKEKKIVKFKSDKNISYKFPIEKIQNGNNNFNQLKSGEIVKTNFMNSMTERKNVNRPENLLFRSQITNLYYCNKNNDDINCQCCPDHICREKNCLCVKCMFYNFETLDLKYGELFNKAGRIAKSENGEYHCGIICKRSIKNSVGVVFNTHIKCSNISKYFAKNVKY